MRLKAPTKHAQHRPIAIVGLGGVDNIIGTPGLFQDEGPNRQRKTRIDSKNAVA